MRSRVPLGQLQHGARDHEESHEQAAREHPIADDLRLRLRGKRVDDQTHECDE